MRYVARKVGFFVLTLWAVVTLNFLIPRLQPGDPAEIMVQKLAGKNAQLNQAQVQAMRDMLGEPNGSLFSQYVQYLGQLLHGNLGISYNYYPFKVTQVIGQAFWWTVILVTVVQVLSFTIGILLGAFAAWRRNGRFDTITTLVSTFLGTLQPFWIALLLIYGLGYGLGWFATSGGYEQSTPGLSWAFVYDAVSHAFLPALTLMIVTPIGWILGMRNTMVMNLSEDYIRLAQAKGLPDRVVALRYAARNALLPSVTGFALALGGVLGGTILVETVFDYPGLGRLMGEAVGYKDYPLLQALMLLTAVATLVANLVADLLYGVLDPQDAEGSGMTTVGTDPMAESSPEQAGTLEQVSAAERPESWYRVVWSSKKARVGLVIVALYVLVALLAPLIAPDSPTDGSFEPLSPPSAAHLLGTSTGGQDIFSQLVYGSRVSLLVGLLGGTLATLIALVVGLVSGYAEGTLLDDVLSFLTNVALVIPVLPLIITLVAYSEVRGIGLIVGVIAITSWAGAARGKRAQIITLRNRDFVTAAKFSGESSLRIVFFEIMPNMTSLVAAAFVGAATGAIGAEAGLAVLGLGSSDSVSWGTLLYQANAAGAVSQGLFAWVFVPGLVLAVLITAMSFINFGVDLLSNPHLREG